MSRVLPAVLAAVALFAAPPAARTDEPSLYSVNSIPVVTLKPSHVLTIMGSDGKTAVIDFNGPAVTFGGDLPVDEAARVFFEAVFRAVAQCRTPEKAP